jgi:hypothetical protein
MRGSLLEQAHNALLDAERAEANGQVQLATLEAEDLKLHEELARAKAALEAAEGREALLAARARLVDLSRTRETLIRHKAAQEQVARKRREQVQAARTTYKDIQRRVTDLKEMLRQEEQTLAEWQQRVREAE